MSKVAARTREEGSHSFYRQYPGGFQRYYDGNLVDESYWTNNEIDHVCNRVRGSSSPRPIGPFTVWRDPTVYEQSAIDITQTSGTWSSTPGGRHYEQTTSVSHGHPLGEQSPRAFDLNWPGVNWSDDLNNEAIAKALARIKDMKVALGENLATATQTYSMLASSSFTLLNAALALKQGRLSRVWEILKDGRSAVRRGADLYLQYRYGWKPLMSDVFTLSQLLSEGLRKPLILSGSAKSQLEPFTCKQVHAWESRGGGTRQAYCKLYGKVTDPSVQWADALGVSNPLSLAWELVPFSFVVDWFVPIGSVLDGLQAPKGVEFLGGFTTMRGVIDAEARELPPPWYIERSPRRTSVRGFSIRRQPHLGDWPKPMPYAKSPFNHQHGLAAFALLIQRLRR